MQVIEIKDQKAWNDFVISNGDQFLQSWEWAEFQKELGRKVWRLGIKDGDNIIGQALLIKHKLPLGKSYLYCPRGPIFSSLSYKEALVLFFKKIKELARKENAIFLRIEPRDSKYQTADYKKVNDVQPSQTLMLDLAYSKEKIFSQMYEKMRYNIRLAQRRGVKIEKSNDINVFLKLIHETAKREKFKPYSDHYYQTLLNRNDQFVRLYAAQYKGTILAAHIVIFSGLTAAYVHGASSREYKEVMAPHLLHWHTIQSAQEQGYAQYDFWGIDEKKWPGVTRFKKSFGGRSITYPGTFDIPLSRVWYSLYRLGKIFV